MRKLLTCIVLMGAVLAGTIWPAAVQAAVQAEGDAPARPVYLPMIIRPAGGTQPPAPPSPTPPTQPTPSPTPPGPPAPPAVGQRINVPRFSGSIPFEQTAVFWFGKVEPTSNYVDVRVGYNETELYVYLAVFDRSLWYDTTPSAAELNAWDSAALYLDLDGSGKASVDARSFRFETMFQREPQNSPGGRAAYQGLNGSWVGIPTGFVSTSGWRGTNPNDNSDDKGWAATYHIPYSSLGLSGPPVEGTQWNLALSVTDRDDQAGTAIPAQVWPTGVDTSRPATWGQLRFGLGMGYNAPSASQAGSTVIRHKLNGAQVSDTMVGGGSNCGADPNTYWSVWGNTNYAGSGDYNVQNQSDISDWVCYSKIYLTFPLDSLPKGKAILSASLNMHLMGNSLGSEAKPSLIQISRATADWQESSLTWNNAPQALENVAQGWVNPVPLGFDISKNWPGISYTWDLSRAVAEAYAAGQPLRLVLYSADSDYHSGKYFVTSDTGDWNAAGRPALTINWGTP